jgi:dolichyl-phosphate-mannose-protein mannosyltransferase
MLFLVVVLGALARVWGLWFGLPHTWARPDEDAVMVPAVRVVGGALNPHWFQYPSLYMYGLAIPYTVVYGWARFTWRVATTPQLEAYYFAHPDLFHLVNRGLSAALGTLTIWAVYRVALLFFTRDAALFSAIFLAAAPLHVRDSHFGTTDVAAAFMTTIAFWQVARAWREPSPLKWVLAGILCGLAGSTKYNAILIVTPALVALASAGIRRPGLVLLFGASVVAGFVLGTPYAVLSRSEWLEGVRAVTEHVRQGHGLDLGPGWSYHLTVSLRFGMGMLPLAASLLGAVWLAIRMPRVAVLVLAFPVTYFVITGWSRTVFFRYIMPVVPFLCLTAGFGVDRLIAWLSDVARAGDTARRVLKVAIPALIVASPVVTVINIDRLLARTDTRVLAAEWMRKTFSSRDTTTVFQSGAFYAHLQFGARSPFVEADYDANAQTFTVNGQPVDTTPDVIVMPSSPLMYTAASPVITGLIDRAYEAAVDFRGHDPATWADSTFDRLDAFFLPIAGFRGVTRPGPNVTIYVRKGEIAAGGRLVHGFEVRSR